MIIFKFSSSFIKRLGSFRLEPTQKARNKLSKNMKTKEHSNRHGFETTSQNQQFLSPHWTIEVSVKTLYQYHVLLHIFVNIHPWLGMLFPESVKHYDNLLQA